MSSISSNKTIAKNTIYLYFRMIFTMIISLFTSRVNLSVLGIEDYGIYQVVGGVVVLFSFLNNSLSGATSRFLTYELGHGNQEKLNKTFATALNIHILVAIIIFILAETIGLWFLENKLVIPENRMTAARVIYQFSIISAMLSIIQVPYNASIISHEKMNTFAYMSIIEVSLKLFICYLLYLTPFDKLITYGGLVLFVSILIQHIYKRYCIKHFEECHFHIIKDISIIKPILNFTSWDLVGNCSVIARGQGVNIILNLFYGPAVNAAVGFSTNIGLTISGFATNFMTAIRPPIVKAFSVGNYIKMEELMINASKFSFCLMLFFTTPFIFKSQYILDLWLKTPPEYTEIFCVLELVLNLFSVLFLPLVFAIHATGNIRFMSIVNGIIWISLLPITYFMLCLGHNPITPYIIKLCLLILIILSNCYSIKQNIPSFNLLNYIKKSTIPSISIFIITIIITHFINTNIHIRPIVDFICIGLTSTLSVILCTYYIILSSQQRKEINKKIINRIYKKH